MVLNVYAVPVPSTAVIIDWMIWQGRERKRYAFGYGHCPERIFKNGIKP